MGRSLPVNIMNTYCSISYYIDGMFSAQIPLSIEIIQLSDDPNIYLMAMVIRLPVVDYDPHCHPVVIRSKYFMLFSHPNTEIS